MLLFNKHIIEKKLKLSFDNGSKIPSLSYQHRLKFRKLIALTNDLICVSIFH